MASFLKILVAVVTALAGGAVGQRCRFQQRLQAGQTYYFYNPTFSNLDSGLLNCSWYAYSDPGNVITLNCSELQIFPASNVCPNSLVVTGSTNDGAYCWPFVVESSNEKIFVSLELTRGQSARFQCSVQARPRDDCDCGWSYRPKIVGGVESGVNEFPFMVSLVDGRSRSHVCGATIVSPSWVVTAAHCLDFLQPQTTAVVVGEHDFSTGTDTNASDIFRVNRFVKHPNWSPSITRNDIALIQINGTIKYNMRVGPVCLPFNRPNTPQSGDQVTILGWGTTSFGGMMPTKLQKVNVRVVPIQRCVSAFGDKVSGDTQICTFEQGKDSCQFDSGGPVLYADPEVSRYFLGGIVSYGSTCASDVPSVSTRVYAFVDWIARVTRDNFCMK